MTSLLLSFLFICLAGDEPRAFCLPGKCLPLSHSFNLIISSLSVLFFPENCYYSDDGHLAHLVFLYLFVLPFCLFLFGQLFWEFFSDILNFFMCDLTILNFNRCSLFITIGPRGLFFVLHFLLVLPFLLPTKHAFLFLGSLLCLV